MENVLDSFLTFGVLIKVTIIKHFCFIINPQKPLSLIKPQFKNSPMITSGQRRNILVENQINRKLLTL